MKKAGQILVIVGAGFAFLSGLIMLVSCIMFFFFSSSMMYSSIVEGIKDGTIETSFGGTPEEAAAKVQILFAVMGFIFLFPTATFIANGVVSIVEFARPKTGLHVANIILSIMNNILFGLVGSILLMLSDSEDKKKINKPSEINNANNE